MIQIKCDMKKIEELHRIYVEESIFPRYISQYARESKEIKRYLDGLLGEEETDVMNQLKLFCVDSELKQLIKRERHAQEEAFGSYDDKMWEENAHIIKMFWDDVLNYGGFGRGIRKGKYTVTWNRHLFVEMTGVKVCPYCNRNYITNYLEDDDEPEVRTTASIDHYYQKAKYPYLQMNIYNMIPSCVICNSYMKGTKEAEHLNPFVDEGSISFNLDLNSIDDMYLSGKRNRYIRIMSGKDNKSKKSIEVFKLSGLYEAHGGLAEELQCKAMDYENFAEEYYKKMLGNIDIGIDNVRKNWFDFLEKDECDEPLIKMKKDIYRQLMG